MSIPMLSSTDTFGEVRELARGVWAYLQPPGTWGRGNAGLISDGSRSVLVDTLNDLASTRALLAAWAPVLSDAPAHLLANTSGDSDHCWGNQLIAAQEIAVASTPEAWEELRTSAPDGLAKVAKLKAVLPRDMRRVAHALTNGFSFKGISLTPPTHFVQSRERVPLMHRDVELIPLGATHTPGSMVIWVPDERVLFAGDMVLAGHAPSFAGSLTVWQEGLDTLRELDPAIVVPGHGLPGGPELLDETQDFLEWFDISSRAAHRSGMSASEAAAHLHAALPTSPAGPLAEGERLVLAVHRQWIALEPGHRLPDPPLLYSHMGRLMA